MIRGALGSRYGISPLGRGVRRASTGYTTWWTLDGDITSCVAAYQPKGAADYATSKVNLANPGTYNAQENSAPPWNSTDGWIFVDTNAKTLRCEYKTSVNTTYIVRYSGYSAGAIMGNISTVGYQFNLIFGGMNIGCGLWAGTNNCLATNTPTLTNGVYGLASKTGYRNGKAETNVCASGSGSPTFYVCIGGRYLNGNASPDEYLTGNIQALAIYNSELTAEQMAALTTAMAAL